MADPDADRLKALDARLKQLQAKDEAPQGLDQHTQAQIAWRMVTEMVAGLGLGFAIGYGLDAIFGTGPFLMLTFTLLGFAAGIKTMLATSAELNGPPGGAHDRPDAGQDEG